MFNKSLSQKITEARQRLDAHVREMVQWHFSPETGEQVYRDRFGGKGSGYAFTASLIAADDKIYFTSEDGEIFVIKAGPQTSCWQPTRSMKFAWRRRQFQKG